MSLFIVLLVVALIVIVGAVLAVTLRR